MTGLLGSFVRLDFDLGSWKPITLRAGKSLWDRWTNIDKDRRPII